jgi:hypothetical protein
MECKQKQCVCEKPKIKSNRQRKNSNILSCENPGFVRKIGGINLNMVDVKQVYFTPNNIFKN